MATLADIMEEVAAQLRGEFAAVTDVDIQIEGRTVLSPTQPCIDIYPADPSEDPQFAAFGELTGGEDLTVRARVSTADIDAGQELLLALMDDEDPLSVWAALASDPTFGGLAATSRVQSRSGYRDFPDLSGEGSWLGCLWSLVVVKARS